jgi:integrase
VKPLTVEEATAVLLTAATDPLRVVWLLLLGTGLRRGEALALRWHNIDLQRGDLTVEKSLQRERGTADPDTGRRRGRLVETAPKTPDSAATLAPPTFLVDVLTQHRQEQLAQRLAAPVWVGPGLVFATHVGTALEPRNVSRAWEALCNRAGVRRVRLHDLRHSSASFALVAGVDMKVIQAKLRQSRLATTEDLYTHVLEGVQRAGADRMDAVLRGLAGPPVATPIAT